MRIESIIMHNYRPYEEMQLDFYKSKETDLHAIIASNGVGKTTLLNALEWCLYEEENHLNPNDALPICNMNALNKAREAGKKTEKTFVKIRASENGDSIVFHRSVDVDATNFFVNRSKLKVTITPAGKSTEIFEGVIAKDKVNKYLPKNIKEYFFFDGEQLYNYFGRDDSNIRVKNSIHEVAQISVVTTAKDHLKLIVDELTREIAKLNPAVKEMADKISDLSTQKDSLVDANREYEEQIASAKSQIEQYNGWIHGSENAVDERNEYENNSNELDRLLEKETAENKKLINLVKKYYTPLVMYRINTSTYEYIKDKKERGKLPPDIDIKLIKDSLENHKCAVCGLDITDNSRNHLCEILKRLEISTSASNHLMEIKNDIKREADEVKDYKSALNSIFGELKRIKERRKTLEERNKELQGRLLDVDSTSKIAEWMIEKERLSGLMEKNQRLIGSNEGQIRILEGSIEEYNKKLEKARKESRKCDELNAQIDFAKDSLKIVSEIEKEIVDEIKTQMSLETMSLFERLIWKKNTYGRISLTDKYKLELFSKDTDVSCLGSCSAAETQLLALAFTVALHKVSGHDAPLFIDTPVGRVSDKNRENFAKTLVDISRDKQIIMSFTPSEYSDEIKQFFESSLASKRRLHLLNEKSVGEV